jgi:hypothetical protein
MLRQSIRSPLKYSIRLTAEYVKYPNTSMHAINWKLIDYYKEYEDFFN